MLTYKGRSFSEQLSAQNNSSHIVIEICVEAGIHIRLPGTVPTSPTELSTLHFLPHHQTPLLIFLHQLEVEHSARKLHGIVSLPHWQSYKKSVSTIAPPYASNSFKTDSAPFLAHSFFLLVRPVHEIVIVNTSL